MWWEEDPLSSLRPSPQCKASYRRGAGRAPQGSEIPSPDLTETTLENVVSQRHTNSLSHIPFHTLSLAHVNRTSQSSFLFFSSSAFPSCLVWEGSSVDEDQEDRETGRQNPPVLILHGRFWSGLLSLPPLDSAWSHEGFWRCRQGERENKRTFRGEDRLFYVELTHPMSNPPNQTNQIAVDGFSKAALLESLTDGPGVDVAFRKSPRSTLVREVWGFQDHGSSERNLSSSEFPDVDVQESHSGRRGPGGLHRRRRVLILTYAGKCPQAFSALALNIWTSYTWRPFSQRAWIRSVWSEILFQKFKLKKKHQKFEQTLFLMKCQSLLLRSFVLILTQKLQVTGLMLKYLINRKTHPVTL